MRIAIAQIWQEANTFNPIPSNLKDFEEGGLYFGDEILEKLRGVGEMGGLIAVAEEAASEIELLPIMRATAMPGGRMTAETLEFFEEKLALGLRKVQPVDGLFLSMHGAAASEKVDDVEGYLLAAVRGVIGDDIPVVVPLDHHANITELIIEFADVIVGYQTLPHDPFETGMRAAKMLFALTKGEISPTMGWQKIPMLAPADRFVTGDWPMKEWFDLAREMEKRPGVISVSTFPVQPWLDVLEVGWTALVITDKDSRLADELAVELANKAWELREEFWAVDRLSPEEAIRRAVDAKEGPIIIADGSDCVLCGAPGDNTILLKEILKQEIECTVFFPMVDPEAVDEAVRAGLGSEITVLVGGKRDSIFSQPVEVTGRVAGILDGGLKIAIQFGSYDMGRSVLLEVGSIKLVVSEHRGVGGIHPAMYRHFGLEPAEAKIVVVKIWDDKLPHFSSLMKEVLSADCPGLAGWDLKQFNWVRAPRPIYPLDELREWRAKGVS